MCTITAWNVLSVSKNPANICDSFIKKRDLLENKLEMSHTTSFKESDQRRLL